MHEVRDEVRGHEVQHDRADDLEHTEPGPQYCGDSRPRGTRQQRRAERERDRRRSRRWSMQTDQCCGDCAQEELSFCPEVEYAGAKRERERDTENRERNRAHHRTREERAARAEGAAPECLECLLRVCPCGERFDHGMSEASTVPVIARPIAPMSGRTGPTRPLNTTRMRVLTASNSSTSLE